MRVGLNGFPAVAVVTTGYCRAPWSSLRRLDPCPDEEGVVARGTGEPPGVGATGPTVIDALRSRAGARPLRVYPASDRPATGPGGLRDAGAHVVSTAGSSPQTKMVCGGYSPGAAVMGTVTPAALPEGADPATVRKPPAPGLADHVAAVVLFGIPNVPARNFLGRPPVVIGPTYQATTIKVCATDGPVIT